MSSTNATVATLHRQQPTLIRTASKTLWLFSLVIFVALCSCTVNAQSTPEHQVFLPIIFKSADVFTDMPNCRYGLVDLSGTPPDWMRAMGTGWYVNFGADRPELSDIQYTPIIRIEQLRDDDGNPILPRGYQIKPSLDYLVARARTYPGRLYLVGNEIDRIGQDGTEPDLYAEAYHLVYHTIRAVDPSARFAISGLVQVTPNRLRYLDLVWASYQQQYGVQMPVDVWNAHIYVLPEVDRNGVPNNIASTAVGTNNFGAIKGSDANVLYCGDENDDTYCYAEHDNITIFANQVTAMRQWMKDHNQQNKPLIISEYSQLYPYEIENDGSCFLRDEYGQCFDEIRVTNFMKATHSYLETAADPNLGFAPDGNKLVQQWAWFGTYTDSLGHASNLFLNEAFNGAPGNDATLTNMGQAFNAAATRGELRPNIVPYFISSRLGNNGDVILTVNARNTGDSHVIAPFTVTFYANAGLTQPLATVTIEPVLLGCAQREYTFSATWTGAPDGISNVWVKVDSGNKIDEFNENDNVLSGRAFNGIELYLPAIRR